MSSTTKHSLAGLFLGLLSMSAQADWELNNADSSLYYVTSKAAAISELNYFANLSGNISDGGNAILEIDLSSVETAIDIRNQRVKDILFETEQFPTATINIDVDMAALSNLAAGSSSLANYDYNLSMHGINANLNASLRLTKLSNGRIEIQPAQPIIIGAALFGLAEGVEALREIAGLPSINPNVIVDFSVIYEDSM